MNAILRVIQTKYPCYAKWEGDMAGTYNGTLTVASKRDDDITIVEGGKRIKKKPKTGVIPLDQLRDVLVEQTNYSAHLDTQLDNCLIIALPKMDIPWSSEKHYMFSDTFKYRVKTFLLCVVRMTNENVIPTTPNDRVLKLIISWLTKLEKNAHAHGEDEKQGQLRIFSR